LYERLFTIAVTVFVFIKKIFPDAQILSYLGTKRLFLYMDVGGIDIIVSSDEEYLKQDLITGSRNFKQIKKGTNVT